MNAFPLPKEVLMTITHLLLGRSFFGAALLRFLGLSRWDCNLNSVIRVAATSVDNSSSRGTGRTLDLKAASSTPNILYWVSELINIASISILQFKYNMVVNQNDVKLLRNCAWRWDLSSLC